ncbi:uncharacterized protein TNCV_1739561 [Trichonephila clavipes]|nr:uncharacterized protein TNCV_1739561 [Trichonephila clavipes]
MTLHSPTEINLAVLNHKILEANSQVQNVKLGGHQTCLSINRLWHELCDMLRRLVGLIDLILTSHCSATRGLLATDHVILNHGQVAWTTPELAPPLLTTTPHHTNGRTFQLLTDLTCIAALHGGSLVVLGSNS